MKMLTNSHIMNVSGATNEVENVGYVVGYFLGSVASGIGYTFGGGAGYQLGVVIYDVTHSDD